MKLSVFALLFAFASFPTPPLLRTVLFGVTFAALAFAQDPVPLVQELGLAGHQLNLVNFISAAVEAKVRACEAAVGVIFAGNVPVGSATLVGKRLAATCFHVPFKLSKVDDRIATAFLGTPKLRITWPCGETRLFGEKDVAFPLDPRDMGTDVALVELEEALSITPVQIEADVRLLDASNVPNERERQRVWVLRGSVDDSRPIRLGMSQS